MFLWFSVNSWGRDKTQIIRSCRGESRRHDFYAWQNKILFLKFEKFRIPKQTRFRTFVLLLQPSTKPFDHGTSMAFKISRNQFRYALVQSENSGRSMTSTAASQSISFCFPVSADSERITLRISFFNRYASASLGAISNMRASLSASSSERFSMGFIRRHLDFLKYLRKPDESLPQ